MFSPPLRPALAGALLLLFTGSSVARAADADWSAAFAPTAVATHLPAGKTDVIVVGAGPASPELRGAAAALEKGLRGSGRAGLVMNAAGLGPVEGLDDAAIVGKCKGLPVGAVAVVRVFPGGADEPMRAVVTVYDRAGEVKSAFSAVAGPAGSNPTTEGSGVSEAAVAGVSDVVKADGRTASASQERYDREYIGFHDIAIAGPGGVATGILPYQGKYQRQLELPEFYRLVGRADLAADYESTQTTRWILIIGGGAAMLVGTGIALSNNTSHSSCETDNIINDTPKDCGPDGTAGFVIAAAGGVAALVGAFMHPTPMDPSTARELAEKHNSKLKKDLKLSAGPPTLARAPQLTLSPYAARHGGGLMVGGAF